jgi:small acid-soluble spore protein D (minor alpha/beta-type SASP)
MARNSRQLVPEARQALNNMKFEIATQQGLNYKQGYNGDLSSKQNGSVGGEMVKRMIQQYESSISGKTTF